MPDEGSIDVFSITVFDEDKIDARRFPKSSGDIRVCKVQPPGELAKQTIEVLIDMLRGNRLCDWKEFRVLGSYLYSVLLDNDIGKALTDAVYAPKSKMLRVELQFDTSGPRQQGLNLSSWPWEYLYCPVQPGGGTGYFLGDKFNLVLTRRLRLDKTRNLGVDDGPVKVLFVASQPDGMSIEYQGVYEAIQEMQQNSPGTIELAELLPSAKLPSMDNPTPWENYSRFLQQARTWNPHVIHFIGHGKWYPEERVGKIAFVGKDRQPDWRLDTEMAEQLSQVPSVRLVFLQACESATSSEYQDFSGLAMWLAQKYIPAVVGMQCRVRNLVANQFARRFYEALAKGEAVDAAVQMARSRIREESKDPADRLAFGLPVLYLRESGALFASAPGNVSSGPAGMSAGAPSQLAPANIIICPKCGREYKSNLLCCDFCGELKRTCPKCGKVVRSDARFCGFCREHLTFNDGPANDSYPVQSAAVGSRNE